VTTVRTTGPASRVVARIGPTAEPVVLLNGQSMDPRWTAKVGDTDLGAPRVVDGYSAGWVLPPSPTARTVTMTFGPQLASDWALAVSGFAAAVLLGLALVRRPRATDENALVDSDPATLTVAPPRDRSLRSRLALAALVTVLGALTLGWGGLAGGLAAGAFALVGSRVPPRVLVVLGAVVVLVGGATQLLVARDTWGTVDADAIARSLWPHAIASAGLVLALATALRRLPPDREGTRA
jgi:arabinofuranan 3-O-arabinosyltransferase